MEIQHAIPQAQSRPTGYNLTGKRDHMVQGKRPQFMQAVPVIIAGFFLIPVTGDSQGIFID